MIPSRTLSLDTASLMHASHMSLCCRIKEIEDEMARTQKNKVQALDAAAQLPIRETSIPQSIAPTSL